MSMSIKRISITMKQNFQISIFIDGQILISNKMTEFNWLSFDLELSTTMGRIFLEDCIYFIEFRLRKTLSKTITNWVTLQISVAHQNQFTHTQWTTFNKLQHFIKLSIAINRNTRIRSCLISKYLSLLWFYISLFHLNLQKHFPFSFSEIPPWMNWNIWTRILF